MADLTLLTVKGKLLFWSMQILCKQYNVFMLLIVNLVCVVW